MGLAMLALAVATAQAQTYKVLFNFGKYSGDTIEPAWSGLFAQARDGNLYPLPRVVAPDSAPLSN